MTQLIFDEAQKTIKSGESPEQAFARFYSAPEAIELRKAVQITKGFPRLVEVEPTMVETGRTDGATDSQEAYEKLTAMAEELRRQAPYLSVAQALARIFEDQKNAELAATGAQASDADDQLRLSTMI